jgi:Zn-dependent protease
MTIDPLVHMGPWSLLMLAMFGMAWGQMPIDPTRMRGRYSEALVAAAGPASNLLMGLLALTATGVWYGIDPQISQPGTAPSNVMYFLNIFGLWNLALCVFNLLPIPPLDGAHILSNFNRKYALFIGNPANSGLMRLLFMLAWIFSSAPAAKAMVWGAHYAAWVAGLFAH